MMTRFGVAVSALGTLASLVWIAVAAWVLSRRNKTLRLPDLAEVEPDGGWPTLAVIFAARDEAGAVEAAVRSMLSQDYPRLAVIAVDDRSTDGTGEILDRVAAEDARLKIVHVRELPPRWLGKTHALQAASEETDATWILFTDADVVFSPGSLRKAVGFAEGGGIDHLTVEPEMITETVGERIFLTMFGLVFAVMAPSVPERTSPQHAGIGAFNLVRAEVFRAIGGFRRLALSVDDDMRLAQALKWAGYHQDILLGGRDVAVRWHVGAWGMIRGLEKNFFAFQRYQPAVAIAGVLLLCWIGMSPALGLFVGPWWTRALCAAGFGAVALLLRQSRGQNGIGWQYSLTLPIAAAFFAIAVARSAWITLRQGGVCWRGHLYPIKELRAHVRMREAWFKELWRSTR